MIQIRKPRVKLVPIGDAFMEDGAYIKLFGDSKGRVYRRWRKRGWRESWKLLTTVYERVESTEEEDRS